MNREIKFRALLFDKNNPELVPIIVYQVGIKQNGLPWFGNEIEEAESLVLMQFTGLKDKNGKEIYEGDIVKHWDSVIGKEYSNIVVEFQVGKSAPDIMNGWNVFDSTDFEYEVIGNIYEKPELLNKNV